MRFFVRLPQQLRLHNPARERAAAGGALGTNPGRKGVDFPDVNC
jgi:hypothetical protein